MATILIVDDDADTRGAMEALLGLAGFQILTASDGSEVEDVLTRAHVDLLFLDLQMPGMNGWEVIRALNERRLTLGAKTARRPKVIVVSGRSEPDTVEFVRRLGADAYVVKPLDMDKVVKLVRKTLSS